MRTRIDSALDESPHSLRAYRVIREAILNFEFQPGYPLSEVELAKRLEMSRTPIREAIRQLASAGLVETFPYKGAFVKAISKRDIREIYETAEGLEGMAAYLAALSADAAESTRLREAVEAMEQALQAGRTDDLITADEDFHAALHALCNNQYLVESLERLYEQVHRIRVMTSRMLADKSRSVRDHRQTYEAIQANEPERARQATQRHWSRVRSEILQVIP